MSRISTSVQNSLVNFYATNDNKNKTQTMCANKNDPYVF